MNNDRHKIPDPVEPSTHGKGRHVYFLVDVEIAGVSTQSREDIWTTFRALAEIIVADPIWKSCGVKFDGFFGLPTIWGRINGDAHVECRGNQLKIPQLRNGWEDLNKLMALRPMSYEKLFGQILERGRQEAGEGNKNKDVLGVTNASPYVSDLAHLDGFTKKRLCVDEILRKTDGHCNLEEVHADYMSRWKPSTAGDTAKHTRTRWKKLTSILKARRATYRPSCDNRSHPFKRDEYLELVKQTVPFLELHWQRREKITYQKLSDFISLKVADAFYPEGDFAQTSRNQSIINSRALKEKGVIDWVLNGHVYKRLLDLAQKYELLKVFQDFYPPTLNRNGERVFNGTARLIGPGSLLVDARREWMPLYHSWKTRQVNRQAA